MATTLSIVYGSVTITLASGNFKLDQYTPQHADKQTPTITESIRVRLVGSATTMQTELENLRLAFKAAERRYEENRGSRVYLKYQLNGLSTLYMSEITCRSKDDVAGSYSLPSGNRFGLYWGIEMPLEIKITRENEWLANSETELALSNGNGTDVTGGISIKPFTDTQDYVDIDELVIDGDLDSKMRIMITNNNGSYKIGDVWIGKKVIGTPASFVHILDAGDSDTGSNGSDASCHDSIYRSYTITTTEGKVTGWTLTTASLTASKAGYNRVLCRFRNTTNIANVKWRLKLFTETGTNPIWEGGQYQFDDTNAEYISLIREIDTVRLPLVDPESDTPQPLRLEMWAVSATEVSEAVDIDCIKLKPMDGYRKLYSRDGVSQNSVLYDNGILGTVYQLVAGERVDDISPEIDPIILSPFEDNRLYFTYHTKTAGIAPIDHAATVQIYYRIRKRVL